MDKIKYLTTLLFKKSIFVLAAKEIFQLYLRP
jgi:hypothetical protein